jgi:hypothetical protein
VNEQVRKAFRSALAVGITLFAIEIYPNPVAARGLLCASLVSALPTFQRALMRQRFLLMWMAAAVGMLSEVLFRDAPWFFAPFYFALVCLVFFLGSKSRDEATMIIIAYGMSGSLLNQYTGSINEPVFDGFFRAFWCSIGLIAASFSFIILPVQKVAHATREPRVSFPARDIVFLGACAVISLFVALLAVQYLSSAFFVMVTLVWGITLISQKDKSSLPMTFVMGIAGLVLVVVFESIIGASTNNLMVYLSAFLAIVWLINWVKFSNPSLAPIFTFFLIVFLTGGGLVPHPLQSFNQTLYIIYSVLGGIVMASVLWVLDQTLRSVELAVERSAHGNVVC